MFQVRCKDCSFLRWNFPNTCFSVTKTTVGRYMNRDYIFYVLRRFILIYFFPQLNSRVIPIIQKKKSYYLLSLNSGVVIKNSRGWGGVYSNNITNWTTKPSPKNWKLLDTKLRRSRDTRQHLHQVDYRKK